MRSASFLTQIDSFRLDDDRLCLQGRGITVHPTNVQDLIDRYHLTPYSVETSEAAPVEVEQGPIGRVMVCHGSLQDPAVFGIFLPDRVLWTSRGWLGRRSLRRREKLYRQLAAAAGHIPLELNDLCRLESITVDDVIRMSGLSS